MKTFKQYLAESENKIQLNEYDTVPSGWDQWVGSGAKLSTVPPPKGNYQEVPSPDPKEPGTWYLLRPAPPSKWQYNPVKPMFWQPLPPGKGSVPSPQVGDDRMGTLVNRFLDKNGNVPADGEVSRWLKTLPQDQYNAWADESGTSSGSGPRWEYEINPKYKNQINNKSGSNKSDPKVKELQDRILTKDPNALPKFGADGQMGPETRAAMTRLGIKESLELQRILDIAKF
jgi:hypothetical protein